MKKENKDIEKIANELAEFIYGKFHEFPAEEKWATVTKLRNSANDMLFFVAQAVGNIAPVGAEFDWGNAHKNVNSLKTMYIFAGKQDYIELEPEIVMKIDDLMKRISSHAKSAAESAKALNEKELEQWRKKYKIWQEMNNEN